MRKLSFVFIMRLLILFGCKKQEELSLEEIELAGTSGIVELLEKTTYRPWEGQSFGAGKSGGTWNDSTLSDPKTFNVIVADGDGETKALLNYLTDYLIDYNYITKEWEPSHCNTSNRSKRKSRHNGCFYMRDDLTGLIMVPISS